MSASAFDIEFSKYWATLSQDQKKSLLEVIKSFMQPSERISIELRSEEGS